MNRKIFAMAFLLALFSMTSISLAQPYNVTVRFWNDVNMDSPYLNSFMKVYFQNRTIVSSWDYDYRCYHADYVNGTAIITVNETNVFDLLITDGNLQWNETTGCPIKVENYAFWSTVQSDMRIDSDQTLNYWINVTYSGQPRGYFWSTQSLRTIISAIYWLIVLAIIIFIEWKLTKGGGQASWILPLIVFVIAIIVKLALGI
jgi:hypothetical protein